MDYEKPRLIEDYRAARWCYEKAWTTQAVDLADLDRASSKAYFDGWNVVHKWPDLVWNNGLLSNYFDG